MTHESITLAGTPLEQHRHVCAFFHSQTEEYQLLLPFIKEGLERGEKAFHIVDPDGLSSLKSASDVPPDELLKELQHWKHNGN